MGTSLEISLFIEESIIQNVRKLNFVIHMRSQSNNEIFQVKIVEFSTHNTTGNFSKGTLPWVPSSQKC